MWYFSSVRDDIVDRKLKCGDLHHMHNSVGIGMLISFLVRDLVAFIVTVLLDLFWEQLLMKLAVSTSSEKLVVSTIFGWGSDFQDFTFLLFLNIIAISFVSIGAAPDHQYCPAHPFCCI